VGSALLYSVYIKCRVGHYNGSVKFEFSIIYHCMPKTILSRAISLSVFHDIFFDIAIRVIYFTYSLAVNYFNFFRIYYKYMILL